MSDFLRRREAEQEVLDKLRGAGMTHLQTVAQVRNESFVFHEPDRVTEVTYTFKQLVERRLCKGPKP